MKFRLRDLIIFITFTFFVGILGAYTGLKVFPKLNPNNNTDNITIPIDESNIQNESLQKVLQTYQLISQHFISDIEEERIFEGAIQGMLDTLEDPYSEYMNVEAMERFEEQIKSSFQGIGAEVSLQGGNVTIISPIKDSPAEKAGLRPHDIILEVDGESLEGLDLHEAVEKIRGEKGSEVNLLVQRSGSSEPFQLEIIRDDIPIETVYAKIIEEDGKKTGFIEIVTFSERTSDEFIEFLNEFEEEGIDGLIIDVRGNPGGLLDSVQDIVHEFIPKDIPYIQREDRRGKIESFYTKLDEKKPYPISVLVDEGSASASEILAVGLKEIGYDVVGMTTFGKGTVQQAVPLGDGSTVKLTFYKWLSPKGNWIHDVGVEPTIEQAQPDFFYITPVQIEEPLQFDQADEKIKTIQQMLNGLGYDKVRTDGYFDKKMEDIIKEFQEENDLDITGTINDETYGVIETKIIDLIRSEEHDLQLKKALEVLYK